MGVRECEAHLQHCVGRQSQCATPLLSWPCTAQVPQSCLQPLLRAMFLRFVCLMTVSSDSSTGQTHAHAQHQQHGSSSGGANSGMLQPGAAAVLAYRYGSVLLELLGGVLGCAAHLHQCFSVEVQHLMAVPQVGECVGQANGPRAHAVHCACL